MHLTFDLKLHLTPDYPHWMPKVWGITEGCMSMCSPPCRVSSVPAVRSPDWDQRSGHRQPLLQLHHLLHCAWHWQRDRCGLWCSGAPNLLVRCAHSDHQEGFYQWHWSWDCGLCWYGEDTPDLNSISISIPLVYRSFTRILCTCAFRGWVSCARETNYHSLQ